MIVPHRSKRPQAEKSVFKKIPWEILIGDQPTFSMENRLFNAVAILTLIALVVSIVSSIFLDISALYNLLTLVILCILYYFSRFKRQFTIPAIIYCFATYGYFIANYFYNAGIIGPTIFGFISTFILIVALGPVNWHKLWIFLHLAVVGTLLLLEYNHIGHYETYGNRKEQFIDISISYLISITIMYFVIVYIRNNYLKEKRLAEHYANSVISKNEELEELNQVKNRLFSIISHDLRTPLKSIQGYLEVLADGAFPESEKNKIEEQLLYLTKQTQDMLFNLLSWSKSQLSGNNIELQEVNLYDTLIGTTEILQASAERKGIKLEIFINNSLHVKANADVLQLVVRNLIQNAIKFTNNGGQISVNTYVKDKQAYIVVKDNGVGIPLQKQPEIFSSKLKSAYGTNNEKGIGLGLYLCKELIEIQGGKIWFTSIPGLGSEFTFSIGLA